MIISGLKNLRQSACILHSTGHTNRIDEVYRKCTIFIILPVTLCLRTFLLGNATLFHMPMATIAHDYLLHYVFCICMLLKFGVPLKVCTTATLL